MSDKKTKPYYMSFGIGYGLLAGSTLGLIFGWIQGELSPMAMAFGPGIGMLTGMVIGAIMDKNKNNIKKEEVDKIIKIALIAVIGMILMLSVPKIIGYLS